MVTINSFITPKNIAIFSQLVKADFKMKYQGSALGYLWSLLKPLMMFTVYYLVFGVVFKFNGSIPNFPIYLLMGIVLWSFFSETTQDGLQAIVSREDLIKKIKISRWLIILSTSASAVINLGFNLIVVFAFALFTGVDFSWSVFLLPLYIIEIYILALGLALLLSALFVKFRDVTYIWDVVLQAGFYGTPILYPIALVTNHTLLLILMSNPVAAAIQGARYAFVSHETTTIGDVFNSSMAFLIPLGITLIIFVAGVLYFKSQASKFAENL